MRYLFFLLALGALFTTACTPKAAGVGGEPMVRMVEFGEELTLMPNETIMVEGYAGGLTFVGVQNDSRCPEGVNCIQAGEAEVVVELASGQRQVAKIAKDVRAAKRIPSGDIVVNVMGLTPATKDGLAIDAKDYRLVVTVGALRD